mmetsp:Transcript_6284/g.25241  ORF Transcript_6284/g.25241 Transcript_6284/m.25241 type:complete len:316 (-) Transcript_6284:976-1923(-)
MSMLFEMLSRWPRYLSHGPAIEMWSVVHLPLALMSTLAPSTSLPFHAVKPASRCRRWLLGSMSTSTSEPSSGGAWKVSSPGSKPRTGSSSPTGGSSMNSLPSAPLIVSLVGLKVSEPASVRAVTISGEATKACVLGLPSLRAAKLRLNDEMIELGSCLVLSTSERTHWPMHGPHALASTVPPAFSSSACMPSRSMVARICSDPGVMVKGICDATPCSAACLHRLTERAMSSYDELVHEPIRPAVSFSGHPLALTAAANSESGCARSGVKGPLMWGSSSERLISMSWSYSAPSSARRDSRNESASEAMPGRSVATR